VTDGDTHAGFSLERAGRKPVAVTNAAFLGTKTRRVALSAGRWKYFASSGRQGSFLVVAG
jgi:hypothetical protein